MGLLREHIRTGKTFSELMDDPDFDADDWLDEPDMETIEDWFMDSGCEAACVHGCWVEHDGYCEHGKPSWFIKMGLI